MVPGLKTRLLRKVALLISLGWLLILTVAWSVGGGVWTRADFILLDSLYKRAVSDGKGPPLSDRVVLVVVTDASYDFFGTNYLDRNHLAQVNRVLADLQPEAVGYDIIFPRPSVDQADEAFADSLEELGTAYLPVGLELSSVETPFRWNQARASHNRLRDEVRIHPVEKGASPPLCAVNALVQMEDFFENAVGSGHINAESDPDGVYRHLHVLLKADDGYIPTLALSMFMDSMRVPADQLIVEWGERIVVPAAKMSFLERDVVIPIDDQGRAFVPVPAPWEDAFTKIATHDLLGFHANEDLRGNLASRFEGSLVLVGDISFGISDMGNTSLEKEVPLITLHASMLNALLNDSFYGSWGSIGVVLLVAVAGLVLGGASLLRSSWFLYAGTAVLLAGLGALTWHELLHFRLFPIAAAGGSVFILGVGLTAGLELAGRRESSFIRNALSKYVPETVVHQLLEKPELLRLGGEERVITALFSDLANFTTISEGMPASELVRLLNEYLTEMTDIVLEEGGIVDKYEGDALMAEFGAPIFVEDHADRAVRTGLRMQKRLEELRRGWLKRGLPEMRCRVGINTGPMVVGNMGSEQVFDYTAIGDAVNLASRLEGANKLYNTRLMISEHTLKSLSTGLFRTRLLDIVRVKGKTQPVRVYEVVGEARDRLSPDHEDYIRLYEEAFAAYLAMDFSAARPGFQRALERMPGDPAASLLLERIRELEGRELPRDWDGSVALTSK